MTSQILPAPDMENPPGYLELLRRTGVASFAVPGVIGRFSLATRSFTAALLLQEVTGSYGDAGLVGGCITLVAAVVAPRLNRIAAAHGTKLLMIGTLSLHLLAGAGLIYAAYQNASLLVLLLMASLLGISAVSFGAISRAAWTRVVSRGPELDRAFAFEAIAEDFAFIVAPGAAIPLTLAVHPTAGLLASLALTAIASVLLYRLPDRLIRNDADGTVDEDRARRRGSVFSVLPLRILLSSLFFFGVVFGAIELMLVAFAREIDQESIATILLVMIAIGSCTGGITYGAIRWKLPLTQRLMRLGFAFAVTLVPIIFATNAWTMGAAALLCGFCISPAIISVMTLNERITPPHLVTESFAWISSSISVGAAVGIFGGGWLIDHYEANGAQLLVVASGFTSTLIVILFRKVLDPPIETTAD
ncbi:MAG: MFS transporter [Thermomicrobiales bacterium]